MVKLLRAACLLVAQSGLHFVAPFRRDLLRSTCVKNNAAVPDGLITMLAS
jgi:hypothetical protein